MSSSVKYLIAGVAAVALLTGGIIAMNLTDPSKKQAEDSEVSDTAEETAEAIYTGASDDIVSIEVKNDAGGYTFVRKTKASGEAQAVFTVKELDGVVLDSSLVDGFAVQAKELVPDKVIDEKPKDLSVYGLDKPKAEVTVTYDGDSAGKAVILVGNDSPGGSIYVKTKDADTVYTVPSSFVKSYTYEKEYFVSKSVLEKPADDAMPVVKKITIERPDLEKPIVLEYTGENESGGTSATHVMTSPVKAYLDVSKSSDITHGLFGLTAESVLSLSPSKEELAVAGIETPSCTVKMETDDGKTYVLKTGIEYSGTEDAEAGYTGYYEGADVLWKFSKSAVPWVTMQPGDITSSLVFGSYIYDLKSMEITAGGKTEKFEFTGNDADTYKVMLGGKDFDTERYKSFYQAVIKAPAEEICTSDEGIGELKASFRLTYNNGKPDETIEFYAAKDNRMIIKKDGVTCFKCHSSFVERSLLPNIAAVEGDADFITIW